MGTFARLFANPEDAAFCTLRITQVIENSFRADGAIVTQSETKRRFEICAKIFEQLTMDLHWGMNRALDHLPRYLRAELEGQKWTPATRQLWTPERMGS